MRHFLYYMQANIIPGYQALKDKHTKEHAILSKKHNIVTLLRLLIAIIFLTCIYFYVKNSNDIFVYTAIACAAVFFVLMNRNQKIGWQKSLLKNLVRINKEEIAYLQKEAIPFDDGTEYKDDTHAYASDLDIFGNKSLFQHLNRTATHIGKTRLAQLFLSVLPGEKIKDNQQAIAELSALTDWRQELLAMGRMSEDSKEIYQKLINWSKAEEQKVSSFLLVLAWLFPAILIISLVLYYFTKNELYWDIAGRVFPLNLLILATQLKKIRQALFGADKVNEILKQYAAIINRIEKAEFKSPGLLALQQRLHASSGNASQQIKKLSRICANMETIQNPFSAVISNGLYLNHIHAWNKLVKWKKDFATQIPEWMDIIGEMEALNSLANLYHNNPGFTFPELNSEEKISFSDLGHPLISENTRVNNSVSFDDHRFIILTGSNMSGKSTFLRTLGINMVLTGIGAPVCASSANVHPLSIFVSMRQSDSLADSESYFFAEVKRLKFIIDQLDNEPCFVLLDEILRGTNSDDKRSGTIGVIEKIIRKKAIGAIATHDLEVCLTTDAHPQTLINKCFEVEIIDNELCFDYKLRNGICKNKSATFLMKKMEII